jgi:hypothetical protein
LSYSGEDVIAGTQVEKIRLSKGHSPAVIVNLTKLDQLFSVWIRQRSQQHTINDAEDGGGRPDAESKCQNRDEREARPFEKTPQSDTNLSD